MTTLARVALARPVGSRSFLLDRYGGDVEGDPNGLAKLGP